ncbi:MAG: NYN domain-containing protein [Thermincola sp.]|jgi:predicted RNA-binding protein with PIN domain|nr:NYN domain-containing protein [Thermincola sp.]MDT3704878.1 NYN domain-containing protein [Thermincola sp.]
MIDFLVVDGYNIIHAWADLKKLMEANIEHARLKLIDLMADYQAVKGNKVIIVFDAHKVKGNSGSRENASGIEVVFTSEGETADMLIEKMVGQLMNEGRVTVATSDWAEQRIVFGKGAVRLSARELIQEVIRLKDDMATHIESNNDGGRKLHRYLDKNVRDVLEKIRRQK